MSASGPSGPLVFSLYSIRLSSFSVDVPQPLSNELWIILFQIVQKVLFSWATKTGRL